VAVEKLVEERMRGMQEEIAMLTAALQRAVAAAAPAYPPAAAENGCGQQQLLPHALTSSATAKWREPPMPPDADPSPSAATAADTTFIRPARMPARHAPDRTASGRLLAPAEAPAAYAPAAYAPAAYVPAAEYPMDAPTSDTSAADVMPAAGTSSSQTAHAAEATDAARSDLGAQ